MYTYTEKTKEEHTTCNGIILKMNWDVLCPLEKKQHSGLYSYNCLQHTNVRFSIWTSKESPL